MLKVSQIGKVKMLPSRMQVNDLMLLNILRTQCTCHVKYIKSGKKVSSNRTSCKYVIFVLYAQTDIYFQICFEQPNINSIQSSLDSNKFPMAQHKQHSDFFSRKRKKIEDGT